MDDALEYYARFVRHLFGIYVVAGLLYGLLLLIAWFQGLSEDNAAQLTLDVPLSSAAAVIAVNATLVVALNILVTPLFRGQGHTSVDVARAYIVSWSTYLLATTSILMAFASLLHSGPQATRIEALVLLLSSAGVVVLTVDLDMAVPRKSNQEFNDARTRRRISNIGEARDYWALESKSLSTLVPHEFQVWSLGVVSIALVSSAALYLADVAGSGTFDRSGLLSISLFVVCEYAVLLVSFHLGAVALAKRDLGTGSLVVILVLVAVLIQGISGYSVVRDRWQDSPIGAALTGTSAFAMVFGPLCLALLASVPPLSRTPLRWVQMSLLRRSVARRLDKTIQRLRGLSTTNRPNTDSRSVRIWRHILQAAGSSST